ncbi:MAG: hypothetical protein ACR2GY_02455 [Phycisphaerales bacterium]
MAALCIWGCLLGLAAIGVAENLLVLVTIAIAMIGPAVIFSGLLISAGTQVCDFSELPDHVQPWQLSARFHRCPECSYDLSGTIEAHLLRCPECGLSFDAQSLFENAQVDIDPEDLQISGGRLFAMAALSILILVLLLLVSSM